MSTAGSVSGAGRNPAAGRNPRAADAYPELRFRFADVCPSKLRYFFGLTLIVLHVYGTGGVGVGGPYLL
jgi:hypothetical protein